MKPYGRKRMTGGLHGATCPDCCPEGKPVPRAEMDRQAMADALVDEFIADFAAIISAPKPTHVFVPIEWSEAWSRALADEYAAWPKAERRALSHACSDFEVE